jgi:hypothetical protein
MRNIASAVLAIILPAALAGCNVTAPEFDPGLHDDDVRVAVTPPGYFEGLNYTSLAVDIGLLAFSEPGAGVLVGEGPGISDWWDDGMFGDVMTEYGRDFLVIRLPLQEGESGCVTVRYYECMETDLYADAPSCWADLWPARNQENGLVAQREDGTLAIGLLMQTEIVNGEKALVAVADPYACQ